MYVFKTTWIAFVLLTAVVFGVLSLSCDADTGKSTSVAPEATSGSADERSKTETPVRDASPTNNLNPSKADCESVDTGAKMVLKSQTFPIDFEPFIGSCFVTYYDEDQDDPPLGSEFDIFRGGKMIFAFEDSTFSSDAATCRVEAVSFQDLNRDELTDIIVIGKCGAKSGTINTNEVYLNSGKEFGTDISANDSPEEFETVRAVAGFVSKNPSVFEEN